MSENETTADDRVDTNEPAIRYEHITKIYPGTGLSITAVKDVSVSIEHNQFVMFIGSSGGGKTTLLKIANGLIKPTDGDVFYYGKNLKDLDLVQLRRKMGYAIQGSVLFPHLDVAHNIAYVPHLRNFSKEKVEECVSEALGLVGLDESVLRKYPHELSGGQQQRIGIARAIAARPSVLLMDEPFGAVDEITRRSLQEQIARIYKEEGLTVMFVTHDINEALRLGTKMLIINDGVVQQYATTEEVLRNPATPYVKDLTSECEGREIPSLIK